MRKLKLLFCAGGTGGHIIPALAVADATRKVHSKTDITFVTGNRPVDKHLLRGTDYRVLPLPLNKGIAGFSETFSFLTGTLCSFTPSLLRCVVSSSALVTTGSYVSVLPSSLAFLTRRPVYLIEPNAYPGKFTRLFGKFCRTVFGGWHSLQNHLGSLGRRLKIVGVPLREQMETPPSRITAREALGIDNDALVLLVLGGSQGAEVLNSFATEFAKTLGRFVSNLFIIHIAGSEEKARLIRFCYAQVGVKSYVRGWSSEMWCLYAASDVVLARAGALTTAELLKFCKPALLVPHPHTADNHQKRNAEELMRIGSAVVVEQSELKERGSGLLLRLLEDAELRKKMEERAEKNDSPLMSAKEIAEEIVRDILEGGRDGEVGEVAPDRRFGTSVLSGCPS